ncbi:hypothetical protein AB0A70_09020 [Streptomyces morookaense]|uniref:hypothetical protein n=1 Tax=Streptomyces morookaense TaxID=1970 RepID=UPI0033E2C96B
MAAALAVLAAGCGTQRSGEGATSAPTTAATPGTATGVPCPDESPTPTPSPLTPDAPPTDHYAENHGFMVPIPLHGRSRCEGLAAVERIEAALEPLRRRGDFAPEHTRSALGGLGYAVGKVQAYQNGPTGVGFLVDASPLCLEGTMSRDATRADAFGGYPDHSGCDRPAGGH